MRRNIHGQCTLASSATPVDRTRSVKRSEHGRPGENDLHQARTAGKPKIRRGDGMQIRGNEAHTKIELRDRCRCGYLDWQRASR
jgi:hypothetical protein